VNKWSQRAVDGCVHEQVRDTRDDERRQQRIAVGGRGVPGDTAIGRVQAVR